MKSSKAKKKPAFRVVSRKTVFRGYVSKLDVLKIKTASGRNLERELIRHPGAVVIIPILKDGRLILIKQLRVSTGRHIWEFPAGTLEKGERTWRCADRELQEETGWKAGRLKQVLDYFPTPGISNEKMYLFIADDLRQANGVNPDPDEELETHILSPVQVEQMIRQGKIIDGKTILGFLYYKRYYDGKNTVLLTRSKRAKRK